MQHGGGTAAPQQYQATSSLQYDVVTMGTGCGGGNTFEASKIKTILNQHASQGKELVHMYQDTQGSGCNQGVMLIMVFKYR